MGADEDSSSALPNCVRLWGPKLLGTATVWIVKDGLMEKRKTVELFPSFPQPRLRLLRSRPAQFEVRASLANLSGFGVEADEQLVGHGDTNDFGWFAGVAQALLEGEEVRFMTSDHAAHDEQDVADGGAAATHRAFALMFA